MISIVSIQQIAHACKKHYPSSPSFQAIHSALSFKSPWFGVLFTNFHFVKIHTCMQLHIIRNNFSKTMCGQK